MSGEKTGVLKTAHPGLFHGLKKYLEILKIHLCLYIGLSAVFGHVTGSRMFSFDALVLGFFVFVLACGSAVFNNIQDRQWDLFFARTRFRSLPQNRITPFSATVLAVLMTGAGLWGVFSAAGFLPFFWGIAGVVCYNIFYTPLKKRSSMALVPGIACGMLPPLMGWTGAGKSVSDPVLLLMMLVFALWQVLHFFIVLLKTAQVQTPSGWPEILPCTGILFSPKKIKLQMMIWAGLYIIAILLFAVTSGLIHNLFWAVVSGGNAMAVLVCVSTINVKPGMRNLSFVFAAVNLSMLFFMGAGICSTFLV